MKTEKKASTIKILKISFFAFDIFLLGLLAFLVAAYISARNVKNAPLPAPLTAQEKNFLQTVLDSTYTKERDPLCLRSLPYPAQAPLLDVKAKSAILVDTLTGSILYEKNADEEIPPASLTKIVEMYVVLNECKKKNISLQSEVPIPEEALAENLPADASRMCLGRGEHVTLEELLLGLAVASGNDASIATAKFVSGSMEEFVKKMNEAVKEAGLTKTHFVESSGYSEENITTAREFARFARHYINTFPEALAHFHSQKKIVYPQERNFSEAEKKRFSAGEKLSYEQENTNKLLGQLEGCDGLKTGFINESGYNIAVTAERSGTRFLSVTMGGPGSSTAEGNKWRVADNTAIVEYAFSTYADFKSEVSQAVSVPLAGCSQKSVNLVPAFPLNFTAPKGAKLSVTKKVPEYIFDSVECGKQYGLLAYTSGDRILFTVPLVADRSIGSGGIFDSAVAEILKRM
ncbi:MAG: D-alanyl-D-alanine carboxypeptidase [Treponema sp.]|nr:D-alanyl-D-alanine carboxypeptidase [Treponema sp.]